MVRTMSIFDIFLTNAEATGREYGEDVVQILAGGVGLVDHVECLYLEMPVPSSSFAGSCRTLECNNSTM